MSEAPSTAGTSRSPKTARAIQPSLQLVRLPVDKPGPAVEFLKARSRGVMDLIAHFWERLALTPPLQRPDLHLITAAPIESTDKNIKMSACEAAAYTGAMLYVPKAHRADVLALDAATAQAFAAYIAHHGDRGVVSDATGSEPDASEDKLVHATSIPVIDLSNGRSGMDTVSLPDTSSSKATQGMPAAIDFLTGDAQGISWMTPHLLGLVFKRQPARQLVNVVMQLPSNVAAEPDANVRLARDSDIPLLNRWRRLYKEERGILFDADMDAWVQQKRVFVSEAVVPPPHLVAPVGGSERPLASDKVTDKAPREAPTAVVAVAKIDLDLQTLVEIGGVYTFPEYRNQGFGAGLVRHLAWHIRQQGKTPTLQVDEQNSVALRLYQNAGWKEMGRLARVWLTG